MRILVISACLIFVGCDLFKKENMVKNETSVSESVVSTSPQKNPPQIEDCDPAPGYERLAVWKMQNNVELIVCKLAEYDKISDTEFSGWVNIYTKFQDKWTPYLPEVVGELASGYYSYSIKKIDETKISITRNIVSQMKEATGEPDFKATEAFIECTSNTCDLGKAKCLSFSKGKIDEDAIKTVQKVIAGKMNAGDDGYYDVTIGKVIEAAISGDRRALKIILNTNRDKLKVDGASAETLDDGKFLLQKLKELKCIQ